MASGKCACAHARREPISRLERDRCRNRDRDRDRDRDRGRDSVAILAQAVWGLAPVAPRFLLGLKRGSSNRWIAICLAAPSAPLLSFSMAHGVQHAGNVGNGNGGGNASANGNVGNGNGGGNGNGNRLEMVFPVWKPKSLPKYQV